MNHNSMKRILYTTLALTFTLACSEFQQPHFKDVVELVPETKDVYVHQQGGDAYAKIYSNGKVTARLLGDASTWATIFSDEVTDGDFSLAVSMDLNTSYRRRAQVELSLEGGKLLDTINFYQYGIVPELACYESFAAMDGSVADSVSFPILTNIAKEDLHISYDYHGGQSGWLGSPTWDEGNIKFETAVSGSEAVSSAVVTLSFPDGWGEVLETSLRITRSGTSGSFGAITGFTDVRAMATKDGFEVNDEIIIEGMIISNCDSPNMELNPSVEYNVVDTDENARTAYVQSLDGNYGFRMKFDRVEDNVLISGSQMKISLKGAVLTKELDPERYTISSLESANMIGGLYGQQVPLKTKTISTLTPDDVYTYVTLEKTEFVNKVGSYTNVREDYSLSSDFNMSNVVVPMDGWASLLMDADGRGIYAMVNMMCPWRRTGEAVPQGSGSVSGIIVHHENPRYGDMGHYQIRVLDQSGFEMDEDESAYTTLVEWSGADIGDKATYLNPVLNNTGEGARMYMENPLSTVASGTIRSVQSYDKLTTDGNGTVSKASIGLQVKLEGWYDNVDGQMVPTKGMRAEFSTADLSADQSVVAYISFCASGIVTDPSTFKNYPLHWCMEWSVDGQNYTIVSPSVETGKDYVHARTSPWEPGYVGSVKYLTSAYTGIGFTDHVFALPSDVIGKSKVYVRFRPYDTYMASLPIEWDKDIETSMLGSNTSYDNDIRFAHMAFFVK